MSSRYPPDAEWLEADGLGGFASGTVSGIRTRRYHALLLAATAPPAGRFALVNGFEAEVETPAGKYAISSQRYGPDVIHPDGAGRIDGFEPDPWPRWIYRLEDGTRIEQEIIVPRGRAQVILRWRLAGPRDGIRPGVFLNVRPLISGRDYHSLHRENPGFRFESEVIEGGVAWRPYPGVPGVAALSNGAYRHEPVWYRNFLYSEERDRGLDAAEDLASPGVFRFDLSRGEAVWMLAAAVNGEAPPRFPDGGVAAWAGTLRDDERRRRRFPTRLYRAADAYLVKRGNGETVIAGYPWFTDWGRDTFIALRGLCIAAGRLDEARRILLEWAGSISEGMVPNRFPDRGEAPEYNSVDASLWYIIAIGDLVRALEAAGRKASRQDMETLRTAAGAIIEGYSGGTRHGIRLDADGLLMAGEPGVQLTWMDARIGDWVVTPRTGKPVEVQALWLNALRIAGQLSENAQWAETLERGLQSFRRRFWNPNGGWLYDVVDVDGRPGTADDSFRPNQVLAAGGLPLALIDGERARAVIDAVEMRLWTPLGLRSLAPGSVAYTPHYRGGVRERDGAYHQGTVWPWLIGPFAEAWVRARGSTREAKRRARERFLDPLLEHLDEAGLGHISEIADAEPPHSPRGCPFQAWSVGEVLRLQEVVLAEEHQPKSQPQTPWGVVAARRRS